MYFRATFVNAAFDDRSIGRGGKPYGLKVLTIVPAQITG